MASMTKWLIIVTLMILCAQSHVTSSPNSNVAQQKMHPMRWMDQLNELNKAKGNNQVALVDINIPGTHDTMAQEFPEAIFEISKAFATCNAYTIGEQLNMGFRYFDIRVYPDDLKIYHGKPGIGLYTGKTWDDLHGELKQFLHGSKECVVLKVKNEAGKKQTKFAERFTEKMKEYKKSTEDNIYWWGAKNNPMGPSLTQCAGKVVILYDRDKKPKGKSWGEKKIFQALHPLKWKDQNAGKGDDKQVLWKKKKRWAAFKKALTANANSVRQKKDKKKKRFIRNGANANTASTSYIITSGGTPLEWAQFMNKKVYDELKELSFGKVKKKECRPRIYGAVLIDIPARNDKKLYQKQIAQMVIYSNCFIFDNEPQNIRSKIAESGSVFPAQAAHSEYIDMLQLEYESNEDYLNENENDDEYFDYFDYDLALKRLIRAYDGLHNNGRVRRKYSTYS